MSTKNSKSVKLKKYPKVTNLQRELTKNSFNIDFGLRDAPRPFNVSAIKRKSSLLIPSNKFTQTLDEWRRKSTGSRQCEDDLVKDYLASPLALAGNKVKKAPAVRVANKEKRTEDETIRRNVQIYSTIRSLTFIDDRPRKYSLGNQGPTLLTKSSSLLDISETHSILCEKPGQFSTRGIKGCRISEHAQPETSWRLKRYLSDNCLFTSTSQNDDGTKSGVKEPKEPKKPAPIERSNTDVKQIKKALKPKAKTLKPKSNTSRRRNIPSLRNKGTQLATKLTSNGIKLTRTVATQTDNVESESDDDSLASSI